MGVDINQPKSLFFFDMILIIGGESEEIRSKINYKLLVTSVGVKSDTDEFLECMPNSSSKKFKFYSIYIL
jgi:hypothetical protein